MANGSISSNQSGKGEIRRAIIEADLVDWLLLQPVKLLCVDPVGGCLLSWASTLAERTYEKIHYLCNDCLLRDDRCFDRRSGQGRDDGEGKSGLAGLQRQEERRF